MITSSAQTVELTSSYKSGMFNETIHSVVDYCLSGHQVDMKVVKNWDSVASTTQVKTAAVPRSLTSYIQLHLKINIIGLTGSLIALATGIALGSLATITISSIALLAFLDMLVTVLVDKKSSQENGTRRP